MHLDTVYPYTLYRGAENGPPGHRANGSQYWGGSHADCPSTWSRLLQFIYKQSYTNLYVLLKGNSSQSPEHIMDNGIELIQH